ncbi:MAG: hypothetical protein ISS19_00070 [Bacteroidales bacterium]|nr:hypothetical protein [Bacteroidales bacterium]
MKPIVENTNKFLQENRSGKEYVTFLNYKEAGAVWAGTDEHGDIAEISDLTHNVIFNLQFFIG